MVVSDTYVREQNLLTSSSCACNWSTSEVLVGTAAAEDLGLEGPAPGLLASSGVRNPPWEPRTVTAGGEGRMTRGEGERP